MNEWYRPREIVFNMKQVLWWLGWFSFLSEGQWPPEHRETGYTGGKATRSYRAPFEAVSLVFAELDARIRACGQDGEILLVYHAYGMEACRIARLVRLDEEQVERRTARALRYIASGPARRWLNTPKRKGQDYHEFISHRKPRTLYLSAENRTGRLDSVCI